MPLAPTQAPPGAHRRPPRDLPHRLRPPCRQRLPCHPPSLSARAPRRTLAQSRLRTPGPAPGAQQLGHCSARPPADRPAKTSMHWSTRTPSWPRTTARGHRPTCNLTLCPVHQEPPISAHARPVADLNANFSHTVPTGDPTLVGAPPSASYAGPRPTPATVDAIYHSFGQTDTRLSANSNQGGPQAPPYLVQPATEIGIVSVRWGRVSSFHHLIEENMAIGLAMQGGG